jgi:transcriptional regulator GlxA family with amidase domain
MLDASVQIDIERGGLDILDIEILVMRGSLQSSVAITFDMLDAANQILVARGEAPAFSIRASGSAARRLPGYRGSAETPHVLIVPGLGFVSEEAIRAGLSRPDIVQARRRLAQLAAGSVEIAASCTATFLLAEAGILQGRRATTTWWLAPTFRRLYPAVQLDSEAIVVIDGPIVTAGAAMAQIDLMLTLLARHAAPGVADACARYMLLDGRSSQSPYVSLALLTASDERLARAESWARSRLEGRIGVDQLAAAAGLAPRTFARRLQRATGLSPVQLLQQLRLEKARSLLSSSRLSIEEIASLVGYSESSTLRRLLRAQGTAVRQVRQKSTRSS